MSKPILFFCIFIACTCSLLSNPVDSQVKNALVDIERYESQFSETPAPSASTAKRTLRLLNLTRERLDASSNKSHASWRNADQRLNKLIAYLNGAVSGTASAPSAVPARTSKPVVTSQTGSTAPAQMVSQQRVRIKKLQRDIESRIATIDKAGPKPFQSSDYVAQVERSAKSFADAVAKYAEFQNDLDVVAAMNSLATLNNMIAFGKQHAIKEAGDLGDVQATLAKIEQRVRKLQLPPTPQAPFTQGELNAWVIELSRVRKLAMEIYEPLPEIRKNGYLPNTPLTVGQGGAYDMQDVDRLQRYIRGMVEKIGPEVQRFRDQMTYYAGQIESEISVYSDFDPADPNDQSNHFLGDGRADEIRKQLGQKLTDAIEIAALNHAFSDPAHEARLQLVEKVRAASSGYESSLAKAKDLVRMPKPASSDSALLSLAKKTLSNYDYIGDFERIVINAPKVKKSKETSEELYDKLDVSIDGTLTLSGTKTTYFYEWEQFQVATAERVGEKYYIFYTTLKNFTSGSSVTPLKRWVVSGRIKGSEIPKGNIQK